MVAEITRSELVEPPAMNRPLGKLRVNGFFLEHPVRHFETVRQFGKPPEFPFFYFVLNLSRCVWPVRVGTFEAVSATRTSRTMSS